MKSTFMENTKMFLANTSIRGFSRIIRTESLFIKTLWSVFIITNTIFMSVSISKVITDYLQYSVNVQTYTKFDNGTAFPAVTFCNHQPFSLSAYKLWDSGKVMSPTIFNQRLRQIALRYLREKKQKTYKYNIFYSLMWMTVLDRLSIYYQSLDPEVAMELGHSQSMFHNCMWWYKTNMAFDDQCNDSMLIVKPFSHPSYFTCYTVEPISSVAKDISRIGAIIWLGPGENINKLHKQGFLFDIFEQAYGLRVAVHEPGSYPNIDQDGRQIEPGRLNELSFQPVINLRVDSPTKRCVSQPKSTYRDLNSTFNYHHELCMNFEIQKLVVEQCGCLYGYYPRHLIPNASLHYCGHINFTNHRVTNRRMRCVSSLIESSMHLKKILEKEQCLINCKNVEYSLAVSVTQWRPTEWQLYWLKDVMGHFTNYRYSYHDYRIENNSETTKRELEKDMEYHITKLREYMTRANLSNKLQHADNPKTDIFGDRYSFIVIKRRDNNTLIREERFVLTLSALISRIGGLSTLYIGLTFAFFVELIESFYMCVFSSVFKPKNQEVHDVDRTDEMTSSNLLPRNNTDNIDNLPLVESNDLRVTMTSFLRSSPIIRTEPIPWAANKS